MPYLPTELWNVVKEYMIMPKEHYITAVSFKRHLQKEHMDVIIFFLRVYLQIPKVTIPKICEHKNNEPLKITKRTVHNEHSITYAIGSFSRDTSYTYTYRRNTVLKLINAHFNVYDFKILDTAKSLAYRWFSKIIYVNETDMMPDAFSWVSNYKIGDVIITTNFNDDTYNKNIVVGHRHNGLVVNQYEIDVFERLHIIELINYHFVNMSVRITWTNILEPFGVNFDIPYTTIISAQKYIYYQDALKINEIIVSQILPILQ